MRRNFFLITGVFSLLIAAGCSVGPSEQEMQTAQKNEALKQAGEEFVNIFNMAVEGYYSADASKIRAYIENKEGGKILKNLLEEKQVSVDDIKPRWWAGCGLPGFDSTNWKGQDIFNDGDILLWRDYRRPTSNLLDFLVPAKYTHSGVLDKELYNGPDDPCVMTATADDFALVDQDLVMGPGLTYQSWRDWWAATTVTRMRLDKYPEDWPVPLGSWTSTEDGGAKMVFADWESKTTRYGFVYLDTTGGIPKLMPVPNIPVAAEPDENYPGSVYWHCSKTTWWIYHLMDYDIENNFWYLSRSPDELRTYGTYILYRAILESYGIPGNVADGMALTFLQNFFWVVAMPDEIRYATTVYGGPLSAWNILTWGVPEWFLKG